MDRRVVIIEDDREVAQSLELALRDAGFEVVLTATGALGLAAALQQQPDVVLLELALPDTRGDEVCRELRATAKTADVGVLMLAATDEAEDRILGLEVGADDYVVKPLVVPEVVRRVTALANRIAEHRARAADADPNQVLRAGPIELDPLTHDVRIGGAPTQLRPLAWKLLAHLLTEPGRVFTREELLEHVWEARGELPVRTVDVHVRSLRVSLGPAAEVIETVHGFGYRVTRAEP